MSWPAWLAFWIAVIMGCLAVWTGIIWLSMELLGALV